MDKERKSYTFEEIKQKLMHYCAYQDRCHFEVEQKMRDFLLIPEAREELILYLLPLIFKRNLKNSNDEEIFFNPNFILTIR